MDAIPCAMVRTHASLTTQPQPARPGGRRAAALTEIFPAGGAEAAAAGFVLAQIGQGTAPLLWIQDRVARRESGRPCLAGLRIQRPVMTLLLSRPADVMNAVEEGLRCKALAAVIAEIRDDPPAVSFTATKRLVLRAEAAGVPCWLIRHAAAPGLSAARDRWRIVTLPSAANPDDPRAPGDPRWRAELFRSRDRRPGTWLVRHDRGADGAADRLDLAAALPDGTLAEGAGAGGTRAAG